MNHPNRSRAGTNPARNPTKEEIRAAREAAGLTRREAGALIYRSPEGWEKWELGTARMDPVLWRDFRNELEKLGKAPSPIVSPKPEV
jgi:hypothetical protein